MRSAVVTLLLSILAAAQAGPSSPGAASPGSSAASSAPVSAATKTYEIPAGTKVPLALKHAISSKNSKEGDSVYAETTFPVVVDSRVVIPAGTYVQGRIASVKRGGHIKGRAEVLMHFTTLIYPSGYTVMLPGAVENVPGADTAGMKGEEGTIQSDSQTGQKVGTVATTAGTGAVIGGLSRGGKGALVGAGIGGAVGTAIAMLSRGNDIKLDPGTTIEMVIQRSVPLDGSRLPPPVK